MNRICMIPNVSGTGGMVSFRHKLVSGLTRAGVDTCFDLEDRPYQSVLVIGGSRQLAGLNSIKKKGIRIVQRLDGINWIHRKKYLGLRHTIRAEYGNLLQSTIRRHLAGHIVYQSEFAQNWWEDWYGQTKSLYSTIHNGVDLDVYSPSGPHERPSDKFRLLVVEGTLAGGYESGLQNAVDLAENLKQHHQLPIELMIVGSVSPGLRSTWDNRSSIPIQWVGKVSRESIPEIDRSAHILFAADLHPACPNSVIEALACGLPVAAFDTGAIRELIPEDAGSVVPYGSDPWKLQPPDVNSLADEVANVLLDNEPYRKAARLFAEQHFNLDDMVRNYLDVLLEEDHG
jgi:glycosyltransferase involved in cell wall biosynthesis